MKHLFFWITVFYVQIVPGFAQTTETSGIYVWDFKMSDGRENQLTRDVTAYYQSCLTNEWTDVNVLERRMEAELTEQRKNEVTFLNKEVKIPADIAAEFKKIGASIVVFGEIYEDQAQGAFTLKIKFVNIYTTRIVANPYKSLNEVDFKNKEKREVFIQTLLPNNHSRFIKTINEPAVAPEKKHLVTVDHSKLLNSEAWNSIQTDYFEDFTNWKNRKDFPFNIWGKTTLQGKESSLIDEERYKIIIQAPLYVKHKYLDVKPVNQRTDFSNAQPYSVTIRVENPPNCNGDGGCLGRGISIRFDKAANAGYGFTLTDAGDLKFFKFNIHHPEDIVPLFSKTIKVVQGRDYQLGIIAMGNEFFLYVDSKFEKKVIDDTYKSGLMGVLAIGKGTHRFDNVAIYEEISVK